MQTWDAPTLARFLNLVGDDRHQPAWLFLATTGCRRGEALGVRWADVDLDTGKVALRQTVSAIAHELRIAPRTKSGKPRPIEIDTVPDEMSTPQPEPIPNESSSSPSRSCCAARGRFRPTPRW